MTRFMVQWADHPSHLATRLGQLLEHQTLVDVTLMCNTHTLRVHRAVLAAGSPYFETILQRQLGQHPLIVLKDMQFTVLKCLIEFMYCGETSITEDNLPALLQAAKFFQVRGLSAMTKEALGLKSGPSDTAAVNGDANAAPTTQTQQVVTRPATKRVNIEGKLTPGRQRAVLKPRAIVADAQAAGSPKTRPAGLGGDTPRMTFHTIPKTVPTRPLASRSTETQADNARLLLSLSGSESFQAKAVTPTPPTTVLGRPRQVQTPLSATKTTGITKTTTAGINKNIRFHHNVSGIIPPLSAKLALHEGVNRVVTPPKRRGRPPARTTIPKTLTPALKLALENQAKNKLVSPKPAAAEPNVPMEFVAVEKEEAGAQGEKAATLYRDPATNILYQVEDSSPAETETIIYQLPDGTITDKDGNAIVDEEGNTQNINNLQMERAGGEVVYQMEGEGTANEEEGGLVYQMEGTEEGVVEAVEGGGETFMNSQYMDVLKRAGLSTDMPILLDSGDGQYVAVNEDVLRTIVDGGVLQVSDGNVVQEESEEYLMQTEEQPAEPQKQLEEEEEEEEEPAQQEVVQELEHEEAESTTLEQVVKHEEETAAVGKSLPSLDDEGEEEEVITGDPYGELSFHQESTGHDFPTHEEAPAISEASSEQPEFIYQQKEPEEEPIKPAISVEQALEEMMGEAADPTEEKETEHEQTSDLQSDQQTELDNLQNVLNSSMESTTTNSAFQNDVSSVLMPGDDSSVTNQTEDSLINENELEDCHLKSSSLLLKNALRESGIVGEGDLEENLERDDSLDKLNAASAEENSVESLDEMPPDERAMKEMVYEITNEDGEKSRITISGEAILLPEEQSLADVNPATGNVLSEEGKVGVSPSKDIPFAVGLLPLQTALEKIQSMPDYQPRKTRSSDEPVVKSKRKASTNAEGPEKRPKLDESETEDADAEGVEEKGSDMETLIPELVEANDN